MAPLARLWCHVFMECGANMTKELTRAVINSKIGEISCIFDGDALCALDFFDHHTRMTHLLKKRFGKFSFSEKSPYKGIENKLMAYFDGCFTALDDINYSLGGTPFQRDVWQALTNIPAGSTWSYKKLAKEIGRPKASRAVGYANSLNPIAIIIPCHRVIAASGALAGYSGGIERKKWLLEHEGAL